jgi:hypothetical protein
MTDKVFFYYDRVVRLIKDVVEDDELSSEEKIRLLGVIL